MSNARLLGAAGLALALLAGGPARATGSEGMTGQMDSTQLRDWLSKLHTGNQFEIQAARLAMEKSTDPQVKQFAEHMLDEHQRMDQQGQALAQQRGIDLKKASSAWENAKQKAELEKLKTKSGGDFDRSYAALMVQDHQDDLKDVTRMRNQAPDRDPQVKKWLADTKDRIQHHLDMAFGTRQAVNEHESGARQGRRP